ncbi:leucine-rich repeat-containing protein 43-like isoform X3 [Dunckerocampus dactyliophorus]|uniref:leucine-rich repeat-containing protein 43-like isoform X3 n=1 Tax=Dunckerocampus dactyliophorus TaxID=161453 RepID=UPI0024054645|nr:leucine-rich repeat-containing protein 43-like isoform X3 [Dunckerocampus dactyliophorus]
MSSMALSAVLDKHISRLCLNQFPCGKGSWRKSKVNAEEADKEDTDMLLDLLSCPHSPWRMDELWSQQAAALRRVAVVAPERINADFICSFFSTLRIVDKDVSVIDDCLLKFCNLEELVLSANKISEISADNLPRTLKVLELRANCLSALGRLANSPPPRLQYLGLASNGLGSHCDVTQLTGRHWPQLVCLDLSDCDFQAQWPLLKALSTMPCLRTLVLEGNPFTLTPSYPGFTVDALPRLSYLDASWITPEERHRYRGMAKMSPVMVDWASATVRVGRMRGIPDPLINEEPDAPEFPIVSYSYLITYMFFSHQTTSYQEVDGKLKVKDRGGAGKTSKRSEKETSKSDASVKSDNSRLDTPCESRHSTSRRPWSTCVDFTDALTLIVRDVRGFKKFLSRGLQVHVEQEKVLSWPVEVSDDAPPAKDGQAATDKKREKQGAAKTKDKKKKTCTELVPDTPITTVVASAHVPLHGLLLSGGQRVSVLCNFGVLHKDPPAEDAVIPEENAMAEKKAKEEPKKKAVGRAGNKKAAAARVMDPDNTPTGAEATVELSVELKKWRSACEVAPLLPPK